MEDIQGFYWNVRATDGTKKVRKDLGNTKKGLKNIFYVIYMVKV